MPPKTIKAKPVILQPAEPPFFVKYEFFLSLALFIVVLSLIILIGNLENISAADSCGDGTLYGVCSDNKPYYCDGGTLIEKATVCGCPPNATAGGDSCISEFQTNPKEITLNYIFEGQEHSLTFTTYGELSDYLSEASGIISYQNNSQPSRADFKLRNINEENQRLSLLPLVVEIQNLEKEKENQARIAISIVQNIEYGFSNKTERFFGQTINHSRYPYEVIYEGQGICGEKSELLAFLLKEIGYGTVIFYNQQENHEAVGVRCPLEESYRETGYCFVETTGPSIITDDSIEYVGGIVLESEPEVLFISEGESLPYNLEEYADAETMKRIREGKFVLFRNSRLENLEEKYGLVEDYFIV